MGLPEEPWAELEENSDPVGLTKLAIGLRDDFKDAASKLDIHQRNVNIARVTGGSAAVVGAVTAIVGFALIPVTFGLSAVAAGITGASIAAVGGLTAGGASVAKIVIEKLKLNPLVQKFNDFQEMLTKRLQEQDPEAYQRLMDELKKRAGASVGAAGAVAGALGASATAARTGVVAARVVAAEATAAGGAAARLATAAAAGSIVLNVVLMGISLYDIIDGSIQLHKQTGSKAGDYLRQLAESLDLFALTGLTQDFLMSQLLIACDDDDEGEKEKDEEDDDDSFLELSIPPDSCDEEISFSSL
ncbi:hypothetical protein ACOMHN_039271 [Nucella lapillus]